LGVELKLLKRTDNTLIFEIRGEGHTFCQLLQRALLKNPAVEMAGYDIPHPQVAHPVFTLRVKEGRPEEALKAAVEELRKQLEEFRAKFAESWGKAVEQPTTGD